MEAVRREGDRVVAAGPKARRTRDDFFPKDAVNPDRVVGLDTIVKDAVELKYTAAPLSKEQLSELIQIPGAK